MPRSSEGHQLGKPQVAPGRQLALEGAHRRVQARSVSPCGSLKGVNWGVSHWKPSCPFWLTIGNHLARRPQVTPFLIHQSVRESCGRCFCPRASSRGTWPQNIPTIQELAWRAHHTDPKALQALWVVLCQERLQPLSTSHKTPIPWLALTLETQRAPVVTRQAPLAESF